MSELVQKSEAEVVQTITACRLCRSQSLEDVIDLGTQMITSRWPVYGDHSTPRTPISLCACQECNLLQLRQTTFANELYEYDYGYRSGISNTMRSHLKEYQAQMSGKVVLNDNDIVVDIGSNDSTMLQLYDDRLRRVGIDPTGAQFKQYYGEVSLLPTYFTKEAFNTAYPGGKAKIVSSISMFYDLPDPVQFASDIEAILDDDGVWTCEQSYMPMMVDTNSVDTICHEHLEYYGLKQIKLIADKANLKIIDLEFNSCNGGSSRLYFAKKCNNSIAIQNADLLESTLQKEEAYYKNGNEYYREFMRKCDIEIQKLRDFVATENAKGKTFNVYGASTKGNCTLQYANLGEREIPFAVERNPDKVGKMTATGIPIIIEETMRQNPPDYLLVLPWHFRTEIVAREKEFRDNGGKMVFPFPNFEVVGVEP